MAVMVIIFFILFCVSVAALALTSSQQKALLKRGWKSLSDKSKSELQTLGDCCGFDRNITDGLEGHPPCAKVLILLWIASSKGLVVRAAMIHFLRIRYISRYKRHDTIHDTIHHYIQLTSDVILLNCFGIFNFH